MCFVFPDLVRVVGEIPILDNLDLWVVDHLEIGRVPFRVPTLRA